jgi:hypothetical protein
MNDANPIDSSSTDSVDSLEEYKAFIDGLVSPNTMANWVRLNQWPDYVTNLPAARVNELVAALTPQQRELLADMLEYSKNSGILAVLQLLDVRSIRLSREGVQFQPLFPFGLTTLWGSWSARKMGDAWPNGPGEEFESMSRGD